MLAILIGLIGGILSGLTGLGGGFIMVPLLVYLFGMSQHGAQGTSLAVLLPPLGLLPDGIAPLHGRAVDHFAPAAQRAATLVEPRRRPGAAPPAHSRKNMSIAISAMTTANPLRSSGPGISCATDPPT